MKLDNVFPIPIARFTIDKEIVDNTRNLVNKFIDDNSFTEPAAPGEILTTFYSDKTKNFLGKINALPLLTCINDISREYLTLLGFDYKSYLEVTSWLQFNQPGSYFVRHDHYGALISGVLYLNVPEKSGNILFHNPLEQRRVTNTFFEKIKIEENDYNYNHIIYEPVVGEILMFESWLQHTVQQNRSEENRISVGFNIWADKHGKN